LLEGEGNKETSLHPIFEIKFSLFFGMCKSQHAIDVRAQRERRERRKITKSVKEIHTHLNLQPPSSPIASEGEESPKIKSFEERIARFNDETLVQQWYDYTRFNGFSFDYGGMDEASSSHPPPVTPLLRQLYKILKKAKMTMMSEASRRPPQHFLVLNDKE
jgi:superfamily I DNA and/or RNA helicase